MVKDEKGEIVQKFGRDLPLKVPLEKVDALKAGNLTQTFRASLAPGKYSLETGVIDRTSEKAGVKKTSFVVPAPGPLAISTVSLIRQVDPTPKDAEAEDPLIAREGKIGTGLLSLVFRFSLAFSPGSRSDPRFRIKPTRGSSTQAFQ